MPTDFPETPDTDVLDQAADWADLARGPMDADTRRAFHAWLAENPAHFVALKQIQALDNDPHLVAALTETAPVRTVRPWPFAVAGGLAAAALLIWLGPLSPTPVIFSSGHGTLRQVALSDGSHVTLDADSEMVARFGLGRRTVELRRGQAWFAVAHDRLKPFVVHAGTVEATAVGTAFRVDRSGEVAVTQGTVRVTAGPEHRNVSAGTRADFDGGHLVLAGFDATAPDFRTGWIDLRDQKLGDVIDRFNRYSDRPAVLGDPALAQLPVSGRFRLDQPRQSLSLIATAYGLRVTVDGNGSQYTVVSQKVRTGGL
mgnify:CR=1 FL=1